MAEKIISPGVFTNEIDQTFLPAAVADIGAALIGPTLKGPAGVPTIVTSFSEFQNIFGDVVTSGSNKFQFLTSHAAEEYLKNSDTLTVVRILDGTFGPASATVEASGSTATTGITTTSGSLTVTSFAESTTIFVSSSAESQTTFIGQSNPNTDASDDTIRFFSRGANLGEFIDNFVTEISSMTKFSGFTFSNNSDVTIAYTASAAGTIGNNLVVSSGSGATVATGAVNTTTGGTEIAGSSVTSFVLKTTADGAVLNNASTTSTTNNILVSGSKHNIRYEVSNINENKGTFTLAIRAGNDNIKRKQTLETFTGVNLDPNSPNYIAKAIGDQVQTIRTDENGKPFLQLSGSFPNKSKYVIVESINNTVDYLDENGNIRLTAATQSLPKVQGGQTAGSGSSNGGFSGGSGGFSDFDALGNHLSDGIAGGTNATGSSVNFYENIGSQTQGFTPTDTSTADGGAAYAQALDLLANQDEYDINLILTPGLIDSVHSSITAKIIDVCEDRADCFAIIDPVIYGKNVADATARAEARDSNFAAMYWPWVKVPDSQVAGTQRWVPPSVTLGGIYAFNDKVAHPWFAPAGLNRGGITTAIQAERKLTQADRDTLYDSNVNPIATFPGQGVTVFGQKTLQKKSSALDRINVRRLLIRVKKFIASSSRFLVFEQNTNATRQRFLNIVNPFLDTVQSQSGLSAFRVVMDGTNNTPDTIDRNQLVGQLFLQPTRTAEFIVLDFTIQPTGASFPE